MVFGMEKKDALHPFQLSLFSSNNIMMQTKNFAYMVEQVCGRWHKLPCRFIHISSPLYISSFTQYIRNMRNFRIYIIEKYEDYRILLLTS